MFHSNSFVQSIANFNDSSTFETSFEIKYIQAIPRQSEKLQARNSGAKSTPKQFQTIGSHFVNNGNTNNCSMTQTSDNLKKHLFSPSQYLPAQKSNRYCSSQLQGIDMGCEVKQLLCDGIRLSEEFSFPMHPPLLPSVNLIPVTKQQQWNAAYELTKCLRGSFQVKRAKITHLRRSLSNHGNLQNVDSTPVRIRPSYSNQMKKEKKQIENILDDTASYGTGKFIFTCPFSEKTSPFRPISDQYHLGAVNRCENVLKGKQQTSDIVCSDFMIASKSNVFNNTSQNSKKCTEVKSSNDDKKMSLHTETEKLTTIQNSRVKSWANSFEHLLQEPVALATFAEFLKLEFSAENIYFWTSCERYRNTEDLSKRQVQAKQIFQKYLANGCREAVNLDSYSRNISEELLEKAERNLFDSAQKQIFHLMKLDSYQRFIRSDLYKKCLEAEEKNQPLPYSAENLDVLLKSNFLENASPKLKKSASNAEDRRRKIMLPWHRKTRCKSRDRVDILSEEKNTLSSTLHPQIKSVAQNSDSQIQQSLRISLPTSLKAVESGCSLCRVKFPDGSTTIVQIRSNETIQQLVERVLEKRSLYYKLYDVVIRGRSKGIDLQASTVELAGEEVEIEQMVTFKIYLPDPKVISVKSKPKKYIHEVVRPILLKYNYNLEAVDVLRRDNYEKIDLSQLVTTADGLRLQIVVFKSGDLIKSIDYENDISMKWFNSSELTSETTQRNIIANSSQNNLRTSQSNLNAITNSIFNDIIQDKAKPGYKLQMTDQCSIKSEECGSDVSSVFGTINSKKDQHVYSMIRLKNKHFTSNNQQSIEANMSSNSSQTSNEFNKPIIAKLKAGVKLQVTERIAQKQDELFLSLKTRLDSPDSAESHVTDNKNDQLSVINLRRVKANLSPVNKTNPIKEHSINLDKPKHLPTHSINNKNPSCGDSNKTRNQNEVEITTKSASCKEPPPLPPKPKVLPIKPSNWGFNISDQTAI